MKENTGKGSFFKRHKQAILGLAFAMPSFLMILGVVAYPIINSIIASLHTKAGDFTFQNYINLFANKQSFANIKYTMNVVFWTTFFNTIIAYAFAIYLSFSNTKISQLLNKLYVIPRFIPGIVAVFGMMSFVRDTGAINRVFMLFGVDLKLNLMYTPLGLIITNLWFNIPFATMLIAAGLADIPMSVIESARDIGATKLQVFRRMIFPLSVKSMLIALTFVFMGNVGSFTTPFLMGSNYPRMLGVALYNEFRIYFHINESAALSVFMFIISSFMGAMYIYSSMKEDQWNVSS